MRRRWLACLLAMCLLFGAAARAEELTLYEVDYDAAAFADWYMAAYSFSDTLLLLSTKPESEMENQILVLLVDKADCETPAAYIDEARAETASYADNVAVDGPYDWADPWGGGGKYATITSNDPETEQTLDTCERVYVAEYEGRYCVVWLIENGAGGTARLDQLAADFLTDSFAVRSRPADDMTTAYIESALTEDGRVKLMVDAVSLEWNDEAENYDIVNDDGGAQAMPVAADARLYFPQSDDMETPNYVLVAPTEEAISATLASCLQGRTGLLFDLVTANGEIVYISYCYIT